MGVRIFSSANSRAMKARHLELPRERARVAEQAQDRITHLRRRVDHGASPLG